MTPATDTNPKIDTRLIPLREAALVLGVTHRHLRLVGLRAGVLRRVSTRGQWLIAESTILDVLEGRPLDALM